VQAAQTQPDVILMDLDMPGCDGFEATERVRSCSPGSRVVIFTASRQEQHVFQAIQRGAIGYLTKDIEPEALVQAIRGASHDDLCISGSLAIQVVAHLRTLWQAQESLEKQPCTQYLEEMQPYLVGQHNHYAPVSYHIPHQSARTATSKLIRTLTEREREVLDLMRKGRKNREIAGELEIAESTVHKHVQNIFEKLHARNRTEAIYLTENHD
jgi:DNA-binding NarL/FixJ family response regulator